jgi:hypothetical protein
MFIAFSIGAVQRRGRRTEIPASSYPVQSQQSAPAYPSSSEPLRMTISGFETTDRQEVPLGELHNYQ